MGAATSVAANDGGGISLSNGTAAAQPVAADSTKWWMPLIMGILAIVIGLLLFTNPAMTSAWIAWFIGIYWLISGVLHLVTIFFDRTLWGWKLFIGVLGILAGVLVLEAMVDAPLLATLGLASIYVWILGLQGVIFGIVQIVMAFKGEGWGVGLLGALSVVLGGLLIANAVEAALVLPWVFGAFAVVGGIAAIVMAFQLKKA
jgi:uncharacterized membrane protein HdeD (DUF308 family)